MIDFKVFKVDGSDLVVEIEKNLNGELILMGKVEHNGDFRSIASKTRTVAQPGRALVCLQAK